MFVIFCVKFCARYFCKVLKGKEVEHKQKSWALTGDIQIQPKTEIERFEKSISGECDLSNPRALSRTGTGVGPSLNVCYSNKCKISLVPEQRLKMFTGIQERYF